MVLLPTPVGQLDLRLALVQGTVPLQLGQLGQMDWKVATCL